MSDALIRHYYDCFNKRRLKDAASLFADDALLEHIPFGQHQYGGSGYIRFAESWVNAFPNAVLLVEHVEQRSDTMCEVYLLCVGIHRGTLDCGIYQFTPCGVEARLHIRELLDIRDGRIVASTLAVDLNDLITQLGTINYDELLTRLRNIQELGSELFRRVGQPARQREISNQLGVALDAARNALRPHYNRRRSSG